mgnify:CR=1 FL=1
MIRLLAGERLFEADVQGGSFVFDSLPVGRYAVDVSVADYVLNTIFMQIIFGGPR